MPLVADGYWNFGWLGVVFVGSVVGLLIGLYTTSIPIVSWGGLSVAAALFIGMNVCDHFAMQFLGRIQTVFAVASLCWLIRSLGVAQLLQKSVREWQAPIREAVVWLR